MHRRVLYAGNLVLVYSRVACNPQIPSQRTVSGQARPSTDPETLWRVGPFYLHALTRTRLCNCGALCTRLPRQLVIDEICCLLYPSAIYSARPSLIILVLRRQ